MSEGTSVTLKGWITRLRRHKNKYFFDLEDRDSSIECIILTDVLEMIADIRKHLKVEASVVVEGEITRRRQRNQVTCSDVSILGPVVRSMSPRPRTSNIDKPGLTDHVLKNQHMYLRNPKRRAMMLLRHEMLGFFHSWFRDHDFIEFTAPILVSSSLYKVSTAIGVTIHGEDVFMSQCAGPYLEAATHSLERVYNIGPSFRAEKSKSRSHLLEYFHVKADMAYCDRESLMSTVENLVKDGVEFARTLKHLTEQLGDPDYDLPSLKNDRFPRISYRDALKLLSEEYDLPAQFNRSLGTAQSEALASRFETPFWIVGMPRRIEPFLYAVDPTDDELTMTADLMAPQNYGELCGIAEKIFDLDQLDLRLAEKGLTDDKRFEWQRELRTLGSVPHGGLGMGFERFLRWISGGDHVRDFTSFPRMFGRRIYP